MYRLKGTPMRAWTAAVACLLLSGCQPTATAPELASSQPREQPATSPARVADPNERAERLVKSLAADSPKDREAATGELLQMGAVIVPLLRSHENDPDLEVRHRVQYLLIQLDPPLLSTTQFDSGELTLEETGSAKLAKLLVDLNRRIDYSRSLPDADTSQAIPYLARWIEKVQGELQRRKQPGEGPSGH